MSITETQTQPALKITRVTAERAAILLIAEALAPGTVGQEHARAELEAARLIGEIQARAIDHGARIATGAAPNPHSHVTIYDRDTGLPVSSKE